MTLRPDRKAVKRGGYGMEIHLKDMFSDERVVWIRGNSYVTDGERIYSVNGIGEIRWVVEDYNHTAADEAARQYFFVEALEASRLPRT